MYPYIRFMKVKEKRKCRTYKITDSVYLKAMKRAKKEKVPLAPMLETLVTAYSNGVAIKIEETETA